MSNITRIGVLVKVPQERRSMQTSPSRKHRLQQPLKILPLRLACDYFLRFAAPLFAAFLRGRGTYHAPYHMIFNLPPSTQNVKVLCACGVFSPLALMWINLSAANGNVDGPYYRDEIAERMTPAQIAEAQRLARKWMAKHKKK